MVRGLYFLLKLHNCVAFLVYGLFQDLFLVCWRRISKKALPQIRLTPFSYTFKKFGKVKYIYLL